MLPLVEADKADDPLHIVRIRITRRSLKNERRVIIHKRTHSRPDNDSRDHIDRNDVEDELLVYGNYGLPAKGDENERCGRRKAFVPAGKRIRDRTLNDTRTHKAFNDVVLLR